MALTSPDFAPCCTEVLMTCPERTAARNRATTKCKLPDHARWYITPHLPHETPRRIRIRSSHRRVSSLNVRVDGATERWIAHSAWGCDAFAWVFRQTVPTSPVGFGFALNFETRDELTESSRGKSCDRNYGWNCCGSLFYPLGNNSGSLNKLVLAFFARYTRMNGSGVKTSSRVSVTPPCAPIWT